MRRKRKIVKLYKLVEPILTYSLKKSTPGFPLGKPGALFSFTGAAKEDIIT